MNPIRAIIIDDEEGSRQIIQFYLQEHFLDIQIVGEADSIKTGVKILSSNRIDLLFLDIRLKNGHGFDILKQLKDIDFGIIFITAYEEYAIEAIKHHALDYLLKPLNREDFITAVQKFLVNRKNIHPQRFQSLLDYISRHPPTSQIKLPTLSGFMLVDTDNINYLESDGNYTHIHTSNGKSTLVSKTLKEYESLLPISVFCRIHHSYIVNIKYIKEYIKGRGGQVVMDGGITLPVSQSRKQQLLNHWK